MERLVTPGYGFSSCTSLILHRLDLYLLAITVSSDLNPQVSTDLRPIAVAEGGFHCSDLVMQAGQSDPTVGAVQSLGSGELPTSFCTDGRPAN